MIWIVVADPGPYMHLVVLVASGMIAFIAGRGIGLRLGRSLFGR